MFKRIVIVLSVIVIAFASVTAPAMAKSKKVKGHKVKCPYCLDAKHTDCPYWIGNLDRHMTLAEIDEFLFLESHYQDADGEWHVR